MMIELRSGERLDDLQIKGYQIIQNPNRFCFSLDAVLLASFACVKKREAALDLGTGTGVIPLLLEARGAGESYTGLEIQAESADMARRSVAYNHLEGKIHIVTGDLREASQIFGRASFAVVTANPPYMKADQGKENQKETLDIARHEIQCTLTDVIRESAYVLQGKGRFYLIHRPFRLPEIFKEMARYGLEPKRIRLVHPKADQPANLVLVEGRKDARSGLTVDPPLIVYEDDGTYTTELKNLYAGG